MRYQACSSTGTTIAQRAGDAGDLQLENSAYEVRDVLYPNCNDV